jgi:hypothetical protein
LEQYLADLNTRSAERFRAGRTTMVEIRVAVDDATRAPGLMRRLAGLFGRSAISFDRSRKEVRVKSEWESRGVVHVVDAVEAWLAEDGVGSATLGIGDRTYTMAEPAPLAATR